MAGDDVQQEILQRLTRVETKLDMFASARDIATQNVVSGVIGMIKEGLKPNQLGYEEATKKQAQDALVLELIEGGII